MIKSTFRVLSTWTKIGFVQKPIPTLNQNIFYAFSKNKQNKEGQHKNDHQHKQDDGHQKQAHHEHGPGCKHDHGHHEHHKQPHNQPHQHGPGCNHDHQHSHDHHAAHPNAKLSKLTFEELLEINSQDSLKYAHLIYEQEDKKLKSLHEEKESLLKNIQFYKKIDQDIKEKERKLEENLKIFQQESKLSEKRAAKEIQESKSFAVTKIAKQLLEVADCIANCKKFAQQAENKDKYIDLIISSETLVKDILKKFQIEEFDPTNKQYDPNSQQSLLNIPVQPGYKAGTVAMTMRTGYFIRGRLLRSARVGVFSQ